MTAPARSSVKLVMPIWKVTTYPRLLGIELKAAEEFHRQADAVFRNQLSALEAEYQSDPPTYWNKSREEERGERRAEIEGLLDLNDYFGVIAVHTALDRLLFHIFDYAKSQGLMKCRCCAKKPFLAFNEAVDMLKDEFAIDLRRPPYDWNRIEKLTRVRNAIAHQGGWINRDQKSKEFKRFKTYWFPSTWLSKLPKGYFLRSKTLVLDTCGKITQQFAKHINP